MSDNDTYDATFETALDGLQDAEAYCEDQGFTNTAHEIARLYQRVGRLGAAKHVADDEPDDGHWRFCESTPDPKARAGSGGKLAIEQHTETGVYRKRPLREVANDAE